MKASADSSDRGDAGASLNYIELISVLMHHENMSKSEIMNSSRRFLYAVYQNYVKRVCEDLGVSSDPEEDDKLSEEDYPTQFKKPTKEERAKHISETELSDEEYLAQFPELKHK